MGENIKKEVVVVDASIVLSSLLADEENNQEFELILKMAEKNLVILKAPTLLKIEVLNALLFAVFKKRTTNEIVKAQIKNFFKYPINYDEVDEMESVFELANKYRLTIYDAIYLFQSKKYNSKLLSLDKELIKAYNLLKI